MMILNVLQNCVKLMEIGATWLWIKMMIKMIAPVLIGILFVGYLIGKVF